jgi:hypothetical protein
MHNSCCTSLLDSYSQSTVDSRQSSTTMPGTDDSRSTSTSQRSGTSVESQTSQTQPARPIRAAVGPSSSHGHGYGHSLSLPQDIKDLWAQAQATTAFLEQESK